MNWLSKTFLGSPASAQRRTARPHLEQLERRDVPTIVFNPVFGAETVYNPDNGMLSPSVNVIFSGSYWNTTQGRSDESTLLTSTRNILGGPYLSGLKQYGSDGEALYAGIWNDPAAVPASVPNNANSGALQNFLQSSIGNYGADPGVHNARHQPIYVVISGPDASLGDNGGFNAPGTYVSGSGRKAVTENIRMVWVGTSSWNVGVVKDYFTLTLSHELAETLASNVVVTAPAGLPAVLKGDNQIADNEPEPGGQIHYGYRLGGDLVQPYWSSAEQAFIVPDGQSQKFVLNPIWNGTTFTGTYNLFAYRDDHNQKTLTFDASKTWAMTDGALATFDPGTINAISPYLVYGAIKEEYVDLANETNASGQVVQNYLGLPTSSEMNVPGVPGARVSHFQNGDIYWSQATGAHVVYGAIRTAWLADGGVAGLLGLPVSDELADVDGLGGIFPSDPNGRVSSFQYGLIYWSPSIGAKMIHVP